MSVDLLCAVTWDTISEKRHGLLEKLPNAAFEMRLSLASYSLVWARVKFWFSPLPPRLHKSEFIYLSDGSTCLPSIPFSPHWSDFRKALKYYQRFLKTHSHSCSLHRFVTRHQEDLTEELTKSPGVETQVAAHFSLLTREPELQGVESHTWLLGAEGKHFVCFPLHLTC